VGYFPGSTAPQQHRRAFKFTIAVTAGETINSITLHFPCRMAIDITGSWKCALKASESSAIYDDATSTTSGTTISNITYSKATKTVTFTVDKDGNPITAGTYYLYFWTAETYIHYTKGYAYFDEAYVTADSVSVTVEGTETEHI